MPDIEIFKGDADQDYERWRETAVDKCATIPDKTLRVSYVKSRIRGNAWPIVKKMKATHYLDYLDALDGTYLTYDQFGEAETALIDGSLRQKAGETFAVWQARFLGVANVLSVGNSSYPQRTLIKKARGLINTRLGNAMATVPNDNETLAQFLRRARSIDEASQDVNSGKSVAATASTSTSTRARRRAPGDRSPERRQRSNRHKCRDRGACYKCGKAGHTQFDNDAPCRGKPITPSSEIPFLAAMDVDDDETEDEEFNDVEQNWRLSVKASKRRVRQNEILELANDVPRTHYLSAASLHESPKVDISHQLEFRCGLRSPTGSWRKDATLVDTGASACFVNTRWINQHRYITYPVTRPIRLALADGEEVAKLTHAADILVRHGNHVSTVLCYVTNLGKYNVILGMNWLDQHQPVLGFRSSRSMTFDHKDCKVNCLKDGVQDTVYEDRAPESASRGMSAGKVSMVSAKAACLLAAQDPQSVVWLEPHHFDKIDQPKDPCTDDCDLSAFRDHVAGLASVTQEDFEHYMSKMERPPLSDDEIRQLVPAYILDRFPDLFSPRLANVDPALRVVALTSRQGPDTKHAVFLAYCHLRRAALFVLDVARRMYCDSEMQTIRETCALDVLHLAPTAADHAAQPGEDHDLTDNTDDLTDAIRAAYPDDALLQAIIQAKANGLRRLPANLVDHGQRLRLELGDCALYWDLLYVRGKVYVPDTGQLRTQVLN
ncbi:gag-polyprotein aspartyl protease [Pyrenophora tritici-repentis]|nr:gag-polyprotein aspartyl protease [Pyrenophora tritici-repentis]